MNKDLRLILARARLRWAQADMLAIEYEGIDFGADLTPQQLAEHVRLMAEFDTLTSKLLGEEACP